MALTMRKIGPDDEKVSIGVFLNAANHIGAFVKIGPKKDLLKENAREKK